MTRKSFFVGGLLTLILTAAVVGGSFAIFSDNVASDDQEFTAGTVDIVVNNDPDDFFETTVHMTNMEAGDCSEQTLTVRNEGTLPVNLWKWIYSWGDIFSCDPNPDCDMDVAMTFVAGSHPDGEGYIASKADNGWEEYKLKACLPLCAGNNCQGGTGGIRLFFHAVQESNLPGYECVKLEDKASPDWLPDPTTPAHGNVCYKAIDTDSNGKTDALHIVTNAYGLTSDADFQIDLTGGNKWDPDGPCTTQDAALAGMSGDPYTSGYWNTGPFLEATCTLGTGEGVWNYAGVYGGVHSDGSGAISYEATLTGLPAMSYIVKTQVKEIGGLPPFPGSSWTVVLSGLDYLSFTIDE
jgi:predicted ribosomally synthesized peptide with SipW-like signal peptide